MNKLVVYIESALIALFCLMTLSVLLRIFWKYCEFPEPSGWYIVLSIASVFYIIARTERIIGEEK